MMEQRKCYWLMMLTTKNFKWLYFNSMYDDLPVPKTKEIIKFEFKGIFMSTIKIENLNFSYYGYVNPVFENVSFSF